MHASIAVVGLGPMGLPIASRLAMAGRLSVAWNRTSRAEHAQLGTIADSPRDVNADVALAVLPDVPELESVLDAGLADALAERQGLLVVMSTSHPESVIRLGARLAHRGIRTVDAPMSGGDAGAREGRLSLMVGGDSADLLILESVFELLATTVEHFGPLGTGSIAKLCNQLVVAATLAGTAEALALGARLGLAEHQLVRAFGAGLADSAILRTKGRKLIDREYSLGGSVKNQVKDLSFALDVAGRIGLDLALSRASLELYEKTIDAGFAQWDHTAVREGVERVIPQR